MFKRVMTRGPWCLPPLLLWVIRKLDSAGYQCEECVVAALQKHYAGEVSVVGSQARMQGQRVVTNPGTWVLASSMRQTGNAFALQSALLAENAPPQSLPTPQLAESQQCLTSSALLPCPALPSVAHPGRSCGRGEGNICFLPRSKLRPCSPCPRLPLGGTRCRAAAR